MSGSYRLSLSSHYDNIGLRTTNVAEGWHNQLNHSFGMPHPSMRNFLHWLQKCQFQVQCREIQVAAGRPTKPRSAVHVGLDARIVQAKLQLSLHTGDIFLRFFPGPGFDYMLNTEIMMYLSYACYLIAGRIGLVAWTNRPYFVMDDSVADVSA